MESTAWNGLLSVSTPIPPVNVTTESPSNYDHEGAMKFIISTILVYSLLGIVSMLISRLRKKSNSYGRQLDDDVSHFIKTGKTLRQSFHRQQLIFRRNTFVKMIKTREAMEALGMDVDEDGPKTVENGGEKEKADDTPRVTFHIENEDEKDPETPEMEKIPLKTLAESSCQTDDDLSSYC